MQVVQTIEALPDSTIQASAAYFASHLDEARALVAGDSVTGLAIVLPTASSDHDDWRRALARDLARSAVPKRVNVVAGTGEALSQTLAYLADAPGVTGQYLPVHD